MAQSRNQRITLKGCGISFDAPAASTPWRVTTDSGPAASCEADLEAEVPGHPPKLDSPDKLRIEFRVISSPKESCATVHQRAIASKSSGLFVPNPDGGSPGFIPTGWFPRARVPRPYATVVCMDLPSGRLEATITFSWLGSEIKPPDHSILQALLTSAGNAARARETGATRTAPAPNPSPTR
jgi:hypothetical protein